MADTLRVERTGDVVEVTIDRPSRRNALDKDLWVALRREGLALQDPAPRAVILCGAGEHFCAGMDLSADNPLLTELQGPILAGDVYRLSEVIRDLKRSFGVWTRIPAPVIAAIEGACLGGGLELALVADLRICGESAVFSMPETRFGMVPDVGGTVRLGKLVGTSRAAHLILTGERIDAATALQWGLVSEVVPDGQVLERARELAASILKGSPAATVQALMVLRHAFEFGDDERFEMETEAGALALASRQVLKGLASFGSGSEPDW